MHLVRKYCMCSCWQTSVNHYLIHHHKSCRFLFIAWRISSARFECQINITKWDLWIHGCSVSPEKNSRCLHLRLHPVRVADGEIHTSALFSLITAWRAPSCSSNMWNWKSGFLRFIKTDLCHKMFTRLLLNIVWSWGSWYSSPLYFSLANIFIPGLSNSYFWEWLSGWFIGWDDSGKTTYP